MHIEFGTALRPPEQVQRAWILVCQQIFDHGFQWCKSGAATHQDHWTVKPVITYEKRAQRCFEPEDVTLFHLVKYPTGETATIDVADMQLDLVFELWWAGNGKRPSLAFRQQYFQVLPGEKL